ncbi:diguanylate cyclase [Paraglaciecola sp. L3A3]|uniref:sensor domain-containing diguanylate cyclase n=1 Tax=Paraglaciecola sp. L3A3 TaxID=2686358 RepID=UPI00131BDFD9|nr:diguanylate cyclase [Paraglaciecola sp. L3A3]
MGNFNKLTLKNLLENANIGVVIHKWDTTVVYANPTALQLLRLTYEQIIGRDAYDPQWRFLDEANRPLINEQFPVSQVKRFKNPIHNVVLGVIDGKQEKPSWLMVNAYPELAEDDKNNFIVVTFNDITDKKSSFSFQSIADNAEDIIIVTEADDITTPLGPRIIYVNDAFEKLTGFSREEAIGETPRILQGKETDKDELKRISLALQNRQSISSTLRNYTKTGHPYWLSLNIFPLKNKYGEVTHFAAIERDVTNEIYSAQQLETHNQNLKELKSNLEELVRVRTQELHDANKQLYRFAYQDVLTKLPNRRSFLEQAEQQISRAVRAQQTILTGLLDIDNFKQINDTYGHETGDKVLIKVAECFSVFFRQEDCYSRYGGEEFTFCILLQDNKQAMDICQRLRTSIADLVFDVAPEASFQITVSIGASVSKANANSNLEFELNVADRALYKAKNTGRNRVEITIK